jgi:lactoylglutathione lyase
MTVLRHVALSVPDPEVCAVFFEQAFGMRRCGEARRGIYVTDGTINVALLRTEDGETPGTLHFGMWVDDFDAAADQIVAAGGTCTRGKPETPKSYYEAKFEGPTGVSFDVTHTGWAGAVK